MYDDIKNGVAGLPHEEFKDNVVIALMVSGIKAAWTYLRLSYGTLESVVPMLREKSKWKPHKDQSNDEEHRGGSACSSDEISVM